ncbi:uncharacterized protein LOC123684231 [Harmonia axyridis]|uniref:uncharacterized protein LOC123684231 n=1 Tax=Harmonia axyridis TaxID=115357 RepID=UPI001E2752FC|nr:uncharacterized protein LOC123684231 [Harmonia axyridis]
MTITVIRISKILFLVFLTISSSSAQRCIFPGRYRDYTDATGRLYYACNAFDGTPVYFRCPKNEIFNDLTQVCEAKASPSALICSWIQIVLGKTPDPDGDGTTYIDCTQPSLGPRIVLCVKGLFSPILLCCYDGSTCYY